MSLGTGVWPGMGHSLIITLFWKIVTQNFVRYFFFLPHQLGNIVKINNY